MPINKFWHTEVLVMAEEERIRGYLNKLDIQKFTEPDRMYPKVSMPFQGCHLSALKGHDGWRKLLVTGLPQILPEAISTRIKNNKEQAWSYQGQIVPGLTDCFCYDDSLGFFKTLDMVSHRVAKLRRHGLDGRSTNE